MAIHALNCFVVSTSQLSMLGPKAVTGQFEKLDVKQRDLSKSHAEQFTETILSRFSKNSNLPVLETCISLSVHAKASKLKVVAKAVNSGKLPNLFDVEAVNIVDGQHRFKALERDFKINQRDHKVMVVMTVCDEEDDEADMFFNINGRGRKPAPGLIDLQLARKFKKNNYDLKYRTRAIASLIAYNIASMPNWTFADAVERPAGYPPVKSPTVHFHRLVGLLYPIAEHLQHLSDEEILAKIKDIAKLFCNCWIYLSISIDYPLLTDETKLEFNKAHVFNIFTAGLIVPAVIANKVTLLTPSLFAEISEEFIDWLMTNETYTSARQGFNGLGGESSERPYIEKLKELSIKN